QVSGDNRVSGGDEPNGGGRATKRSAAVAASRKVHDILVASHQAGSLNDSCAGSSGRVHDRERDVAAPHEAGGVDTTSSGGGGSGSSSSGNSSSSDSGDEGGPDNGTTRRADDNALKAGMKRRRSRTRVRSKRHGSGSASSTSTSSTSMPQDYLWEQLERLPRGRSSCTSMTHRQSAMQGVSGTGRGKDSTAAATATQEGAAPATVQRRATGRRRSSRGGGSSRGRGSGSCCKKKSLALGLFLYIGLSDDGVGQAALSSMHPYYRGVGTVSNKEQPASEPAIAQVPRSTSTGRPAQVSVKATSTSPTPRARRLQARSPKRRRMTASQASATALPARQTFTSRRSRREITVAAAEPCKSSAPVYQQNTAEDRSSRGPARGRVKGRADAIAASNNDHTAGRNEQESLRRGGVGGNTANTSAPARSTARRSKRLGGDGRGEGGGSDGGSSTGHSNVAAGSGASMHYTTMGNGESKGRKKVSWRELRASSEADDVKNCGKRRRHEDGSSAGLAGEGPGAAAAAAAGGDSEVDNSAPRKRGRKPKVPRAP
ncbi:unnamed protein product, partial [Sphacelaria rigidula]